MSVAFAKDHETAHVVRPTTNAAFRVNNFDLIRLFAALQVVVLHSYDRFGQVVPAWMTPLSWFPGVPIFFVISGFLISASLERNSDLKVYARNRLLRIYPGLWACVLATVVVAICFGFGFANLSAAMWFALQLAGVIYTPGFLADFGSGTYNGSLWTIPIELQFYAVLPVAYWCLSRSRNKTRDLILVFLLFVAIGAAVKLAFPAIATSEESKAVKLLRYSFIPRFYLFMLGVVLQRLHVHVSPYIRGRGMYWLATFALFKLLIPPVGLMYMVSEIFMTVTVISLAYTVPHAAERLLRGNDVSYGVYLYHGLVINIIVEAALPRNAMSTPIVLLSALLLGYISWVLIERPVIRTKGRRSLKPASPATAATASTP